MDIPFVTKDSPTAPPINDMMAEINKEKPKIKIKQMVKNAFP